MKSEGEMPLGQFVLFFALLLQAAVAYEPKPVALVLPLDARSQLALQEEGVQLLRSITGPIVPVVVIGPYRSGKSFTLNQLLGVPCNQGFGVGHTRDTQTKGIWLWGEPLPRTEPDGGSSMVLYVDTEGFESTGKTNSYDDRIFALSAVMSSLLVYNLPETIRESDVSKLSFAVDLAQGFYDRVEREAHAGGGGGSGSSSGGSSGGSVDPGSMLWLIQRDFLEGKTADQMVQSVLAQVPNPHGEKDIEALNEIRRSLTAIARNSTGYSLRQPHLDRTRLCDIPDSELDHTYVQQRDGLKQLVQSLAHPKVINGRTMTGTQLAELVGQMVKVLNTQEIPNVASMIQAFNGELLKRCLDLYVSRLSAIALPTDESELDKADLAAKSEALVLFQASRVGRQRSGSDVKEQLVKDMQREYQVRQTENLAASNQQCSELEAGCEAELDAATSGGMRLPSLRKFEAAFQRCEKRFTDKCVGPGLASNQDRLHKAWARSRKQFEKEYNDRLFTGLIILSLACVVLFRFVFRLRLLEAVGWVAFLFLELYPKVYPGNIYDTEGWHLTVRLWEACIWILFGFEGSSFVWLGLLIAAVVWRLVAKRQPLGAMLRRKKKTSLGDRVRDLDV